MTEQKLDIILHELTEIKTVVITKFSQIEEDLSGLKSDVASLKSEMIEVKANIAKLDNRLKIVEIRLSLIEQRLANIEPWISVNNRDLLFDTAKHNAA
jgi:predicted  nucleic acid-binding Zn-ribbon protein